VAQIDILLAARLRILNGDNATIAGAIMGMPDTDDTMQSIEDTYARASGGSLTDALDNVELEIAAHFGGVSNAYSYLEADILDSFVYATSAGGAGLPEPMPRMYGLYAAVALAINEPGTYLTIEDAVTWVLANITFS
jgi:hypothetical protein